MAVKKDCIELIYKIKPGVFMIVNLLRTKGDEVLLFTNLGNYFKRLQNPQVQLPQIKRTCPKLYRILTGDDEVKELELPATSTHGFDITYKVVLDQALFASIDKNVLKCFTGFVQKNLDIFFQLQNTPPFPAWKDGLKELWN